MNTKTLERIKNDKKNAVDAIIEDPQKNSSKISGADDLKRSVLISMLTGESEENKAEENKAEENKAEENKAEENKAEENKAEENKAEENKAEENSSNIKSFSQKETDLIKLLSGVDPSENNIKNENTENENTDSKNVKKLNSTLDTEPKSQKIKIPELKQGKINPSNSKVGELAKSFASEFKSIPKQENKNTMPTSIHFKNNKEFLVGELIKELVPASERYDFLNKLRTSPNFFPPKVKGNNAMLIHWNGRFGNRMHTYAYLHNRAKMHGGKVILPSDWEGSKLFNLDYEIVQDDDLRKGINQTAKDFDKLSYRMDRVRDYNDKSNSNFRYCNPDNPKETYTKYDQGVVVDSVCAYHHEIFDKMNLSDVLKLYEFKDEVKNLDLYKRMEDKQGTYDIAHLRRDDISNVNYKKNGGYSVISKESYLKAFKKYDYDPEKIVWTSDDWTGEWGVGNSLQSGLISKRGAWNYPSGSEYIPEIIFDWFPDFLRLYFARSIFRANSSFSFWACALSKGRETPPRIFAPRLNKRILYAKEETYKQEADFEFEESNSPHWLCITGKDNCDDILFADEK